LVDDTEFTVAIAVVPAAVAAGMRAEEEAGEKDDGDDEDDARHDAHPGGRCGEPAVASRLGRCGRRRFGGGHWAGRRFRRRRCFAHEPEHASDGDVPVMN
jgi:hypothetical protein